MKNEYNSFERKEPLVIFESFDLEPILKQANERKAKYISMGLDKDALDRIITNDDKMFKIFNVIPNIIKINYPVLLLGPTGSGKAGLAFLIYKSYKNRDGKFIDVNCSAVPDTLFEKAFYGHTKGSFTSAINNQIGYFKMADGGTIFLDEIGDLSLAGQAKILKTIETSEIPIIGSKKSIKVDVNIISGTNKDISNPNIFREDLFYRINVIKIIVPALKERKNDILLLINHIIATELKSLIKQEVVFDKEATKTLLEYHWPGNIRQLKGFLINLLIQCDSNRITIKDLPSYFKNPSIINNNSEINIYYNLLTRAGKTHKSKKSHGLILKAWRIGREEKIITCSKDDFYKNIADGGIKLEQFIPV